MLKISVKDGEKIKVGNGHIHVKISKFHKKVWLTFDHPRDIDIKRGIKDEQKNSKPRTIEPVH